MVDLLRAIPRGTAMLSLALLAGCGQSGAEAATVDVRLTAERTDYNLCRFTAHVENRTPNHITTVVIEVGGQTITLNDLRANGALDVSAGDEMVQPGERDYGSCLEDTQRLFERTPFRPVVTQCEMPNVTEGDCQNFVKVRAGFDDAAIKRSDDAVMKAAR